MLFSSVEFLYYFLPITLVLYFLTPMPSGSPKLRNHTLLIASLVFYGWGGPSYLLLITGQTLFGWIFGLLIEKFRGDARCRLALIGALIMGIGGLMFFKYADFFVSNLNALFQSSVPLLGIALPIGVSFYTFQILSYNIDLYRGKIKVQHNFLTLFTYVAVFPPLIAGPIVRYSHVERELENRLHVAEDFAYGTWRFVIGLSKKVLIANPLGGLAEICKMNTDQSISSAWIYLLAYALHIYFDFSGYSDMAIGMGRMFGFRFHENFNYPYISKSATEFWRRWHISLSEWFRDYVYIPLGGNRVSKPRHVFNIIIVWLLTGFWHGADWNFIAWGLYFGLLLLLEKNIYGRFLENMPRIISHAYFILCMLIGWAFFDAESIGTAAIRIGYMFGIGTSGFVDLETLYYMRSYFVLLVLAAVGATPIPSHIAAKISESSNAERGMTIVEPFIMAVLLIVVTAYLIDGSFNPFIYFRF